MTTLKFEQDGALADGEKTYRLVIDGKTVSEGLTLDQVIRAINKRDEEKLGEDQGPETPQSPPRAAATAPLAGEPRAERRKKAAAGPGCRR